MCQLSSTIRRMTTIGSSVLGELNGWRPVSSTYASTPRPHLQRGAGEQIQARGIRIWHMHDTRLLSDTAADACSVVARSSGPRSLGTTQHPAQGGTRCGCEGRAPVRWEDWVQQRLLY